jgi:hypothetical protein
VYSYGKIKIYKEGKKVRYGTASILGYTLYKNKEEWFQKSLFILLGYTKRNWNDVLKVQL